MTRIWILGSADPEMEAIENLLREAGQRIVYALGPDGQRARAGDAYRVAALSEPIPPATVYRVECDGPAIPADAIVIDHHRPGDPGYGRPPTEFLPASSLGQTLAALARLDALVDFHGDAYNGPARWIDQLGGMKYDTNERAWSLRARKDWIAFPCGAECCGYELGPMAKVPHDIVLAAAADHCLAAAYRGECPGVDPDALMQWRVECRAAFQRRSVNDVLADVERAREALREAPVLILADAIPCDYHAAADVQCGHCRQGVFARDMRGQHVPELPEASAREGECFVASLRERDGRTKIVCFSDTPAQIDAFMRVWGPEHGLTDIYGDPARGFAGGYVAPTDTQTKESQP